MPVSKKPRAKRTAKAPSRSGAAAAPALPDRRAMERFMVALSGERGGSDDPTAKAQDVMYEAWEQTTARSRIALARKALGISPLCADAYVLLAEEGAKSVAEAKELYARGVEAGELALGPKAFKEDVGLFWGFLETRPYMRARAGLAQALWALGDRDEAVAHYRDMLRLNPNDNQGIRYILASALLEIGDDEALRELLKAHDEDGSPYWTYTKALLAFRASGATKEAAALLTEAMRSNRHVPAFLSGEKGLPKAAPDYITMGGEDEAAVYARDCGAAWRQTAGALDWLRQVAAEPLPPSRRGSRAIH
jgi:tetratricopeptide (TPR) repeat protein